MIKWLQNEVFLLHFEVGFPKIANVIIELIFKRMS